MKIYVASSWRNEFFPEVVKALKEAGLEVYDFRHPEEWPYWTDSHNRPEFKWEYVSPDYKNWSAEEYRENLHHPLAEAQFKNDLEAMEACDGCVLVLPCGRSAHTEAGWFAGKGRKVVVYMPVFDDADLMYKLFDCVATTMDEVINSLKRKEATRQRTQRG